jgi:hypothetical protein
VSHPSLGRPPTDQTAGLPDAAARIRRDAARLAARALEVAIDRDPSFRTRYDEVGLRARLRDAQLLAVQTARAIATGDPESAYEYAERTSPVYRRKRVPMDDLIALCEGLRAALPVTLSPDELAAASAALDRAIAAYRWHRRIAGDARKRNALLQLIYKGG